MKKLLITTGLVLGLSGLYKAQNGFTVKLGDNVCLTSLEVRYSDMTTETFALGCTGAYGLNISPASIDALWVDGVLCEEGETTITVNGQALRSVNDSKRGILGIIK